LYIGVGGGIILMLIVIALIVWRRNKTVEGWADYDDDDGQEDTTQSFLSDKRRRGSSDRKSYQSPKKGGSGATGNGNQQQQGLLDGKYRFVQRLGKGSFSVVYLVERVADQQRFALKYVQIGDDSDRHEAMKECEVVHRLQGHPNVIHLYDMFMSYRFDTNLLPEGNNSPNGGASINSSNKQSPRYFDATNFGVRVDEDAQRAGTNRQVSGERFLSLVMEYHERGDLGKWAKKQKGDPRVPEATVLSIAFQTLSVLNYMHSSNPPIIHRDLKPENILLSSVVYENMSSSFLPIVVTDFGLSRVMDKTFCETGVGSLPYVAPECWQRCYSTKVDIWALGCILYAVCAKRVEPDNVKVMFSESTRPDFYKKLFHELNTVYGYSEACAKFIITLLDVDPNHRPAAADALKRMKRRRAAASGLSNLRKESELDNSESSLKSYGSEEMGKDAQCEFYIPSDTFFGVLSNGWNLNAPTNYGTNDLPLGMVTSGPLPQMPIRHPSASIGPQVSSTSSRSIPSAALQQPQPQPNGTNDAGNSSTTSSSNQTVNDSKGSSKGAAAPPPFTAQTLAPKSGDADDESVCSMKVLVQEGPCAENK
jgi:serine/threonine protein kinase